jgi:CheY-like chemotaxis protein
MKEESRILVVDDEKAIRGVLATRLEGEGFKVATAGDGKEAIDILLTQHFDLILLDIKMPEVDGFEVLNFAKKKHPDTKVIMLTGYADLRNALDSKRLGAEQFVGKPYEFSELLDTIRRVLSGA